MINFVSVPEKITLDSIDDIANKYGVIALKVKGDCMAGVNIHDSDIIAVDLTKKPIPRKKNRDAVVIWDVKGNSPAVKEYIGAWGNMQMVSTRYADIGFTDDGSFKMNHDFMVSHILGVVCACYTPDGELKWEKDVSNYPEELSYKQMIKGSNVGSAETVNLNKEAVR